MIKKLNRDFCIIKYRKLPLSHPADDDSDISFFPKFKSHYWIKLQDDSDKEEPKFILELIQLIHNLNIENLIFLDELNKPWITKSTAERIDYKPLVESLEYFKSIGIGENFNGGVIVSYDDLSIFFPHFYTITQCDSCFFDYHFIDENQNILFYIHYSGEIQIITLNSQADEDFLKQIKKTSFVDSFRENTARI